MLFCVSSTALVVLAFTLCWLPFHVGRILFSNASSSDIEAQALFTTSQYFNLVSMVLFYLSASINPVLYNLMSGRYRSALCRLLGKPRASLRGQGSCCQSQAASPEATEVSTCV